MKPSILVPFDFSTSAEQALVWAADLQKTTGAGPLRMIHAISSRPPGTGDVPLEMLLPSDDEVAALKRSMVDAAGRYGAAAAADVLIRSSAVGDIILDAARSSDAELIVMGFACDTVTVRSVRLVTIGVGAAASLRYAPAGLLVCDGRHHGSRNRCSTLHGFVLARTRTASSRALRRISRATVAFRPTISTAPGPLARRISMPRT